jgi:hypothetical protein
VLPVCRRSFLAFVKKPIVVLVLVLVDDPQDLGEAKGVCRAAESDG